MIPVSNAERLVFPDIGCTKRDVVTYYERIAPRLLPQVIDRPLSIYRFPKGLAEKGFFQKNAPPHYPATIARFPISRSPEAARMHRRGSGRDRDVTVYPVIRDPEHLPYLANQGAIELHVPTWRASNPWDEPREGESRRPVPGRVERGDVATNPWNESHEGESRQPTNLFRADRLVIDLDPPSGAFALVRRAAHIVRQALEELGLFTVPVATGSKGYHLVASIVPSLETEALAMAVQKLATLLAAKHPDELTTVYRIALRGGRVFIDWLRNRALATVIAPYSLRARPRATVATPLDWAELETTDPDAFTINDVERLLERPDTLADLAKHPTDAAPFVTRVDAEFERSGLELEVFDRFRS